MKSKNVGLTDFLYYFDIEDQLLISQKFESEGGIAFEIPKL